MTPREMLREIGVALHGESFVTRFAADLEISERSMREFLSGRLPLDASHGVFRDALDLLDDKTAETSEARRELEEWLAKEGAGTCPTE
ncbi:MAG: hypothetical protein ACKVS5_02680 [Parvularculaceae bacterium]